MRLGSTLGLLGAALLVAAPLRARPPGAPPTIPVVLHGASVSAYRDGGYGQWLAGACQNIHIENTSQVSLGARELRERFVTEVLQRGRANPKGREAWLLFMGGLNSLASPEQTNHELAKTFKLAHDAGFRTMGLTINPWGSERHYRWRGANGLESFERTQMVVDFLMGRLTPKQAFGRRAAGQTTYLPGQLPEIIVDVWDSPLRHKEAPRRPDDVAERQVRESPWVQARLAGLQGPVREAALRRWIERATELPRWYLRPEMVGSDETHPNSVGHKKIAAAICDRAPPSWGCDCSALERLTWDARTKKAIAR